LAQPPSPDPTVIDLSPLSPLSSPSKVGGFHSPLGPSSAVRNEQWASKSLFVAFAELLRG